MGRSEKRSTAARGGLSPDKYLTAGQQRKVRGYVKERADLSRNRGSRRGLADELIFLLLIDAGLRAGELCELRIRDLPPHHGKDSIWIESGKGGVARVVEIPQRLTDAIKRFCQTCRKEAQPNDFLFVSSRGKPLCYMTLYQKVRRFGERARVGRLHPHMLRHTYATQLYGTERDLLFVGDQLGHANISTTQIYAKTDNEARRRQIEKMAEKTEHGKR